MTPNSLSFQSQDQIRALFGWQDEHLRRVRQRTGVRVVIRGDQVKLSGSPEQVEAGYKVFCDLQAILKRQGEVYPSEVERILSRHVPDEDGNAAAESFERESGPGRSRPGVGRFAAEPSHGSGGPGSGGFRAGGARGGNGSHGTNGYGGSGAPRFGAGRASMPASTMAGDDSRPAIDLHEKARAVRPRTEGQDHYVRAIRDNDLVFCSGPAGTGKTYLAVAMALNALRTDRVRKIILVRPAVEAGEKLGFLPGDLQAKVNPYLRPLLDALAEMVTFEQVKRYMEHDVVEILPLAYMRGRTLNETFIILDEAQNTTLTQMKMFLTRMGERSKIVVTGDPTQVDLPPSVPSGLPDAIRRLRGIPGVEAIELSGQDIVRHRLVREIVRAYDDQSNSNGSPSRRK